MTLILQIIWAASAIVFFILFLRFIHGRDKYDCELSIGLVLCAINLITAKFLGYF